MADLDNFFAKKDKKKGTKKKGFSKANTDVLAKNLEEKELRDLKAEEKATPLATSEATKLAFEDNPVSGVHGPKGQSNGARVRRISFSLMFSINRKVTLTLFKGTNRTRLFFPQF